jgi:hypothetical protein
MSHDIYAVSKSGNESSFAYFRRHQDDPLAREIYKALQITKHDRGVSGDGSVISISKIRVKSALDHINKKQNKEPFEEEIKFLDSFLNLYEGEEDCYVFLG